MAGENRFYLFYCMPNTLVIALRSPQSANSLETIIGARIVNYPRPCSAPLSKWTAFQVCGDAMITATRLKLAATPISGGCNLAANFVEGGGIHAENCVVTLDVDADTGRHSSVFDPTRTDGGIAARHIAARGVRLCRHVENDGLLLGPQRHESGWHGDGVGIDVAEPVTQSHDAVLLTLRESVQTTPEKGLQNSCHLTAQFLATS
jgi:hypothetical protein